MSAPNSVLELKCSRSWGGLNIRIRIIGGCGSGKSYIARELSIKYGLPCYETDNFVWERGYVRNLRVVQRFIKTNLCLEQRNYRQSLQNLYVMLFEWNRSFDREDLPKIMELTEDFAAKRIVVKNNRELLKRFGEYAD